MHKLKKYWQHVEHDEAKILKMEEVACEALEKLRWSCPDIFCDTAYELHKIAYGAHFDEELAKMAVSKMKNVDGTHGAYWTYEQTSQLADQHGIECKGDFYYVMNMLHSDFVEVLGNDTSNYVRMAKAYMCDPDAAESKVFDLWIAGMRAKREE